eukprot:SAG11_NODE_7125_length_1175_cov_3.302752_1_plen_272_part_10
MTPKLAAAAFMVTAALLCARGAGAAQPPYASQLGDLDVPEGLKQIIGSIATEVQGLRTESGALHSRTEAVEAELRQEKMAVRATLEVVTTDREALEDRTLAMEAELRRQQQQIDVLQEERDECKGALRVLSELLETRAEAASAAQDRRRAQGGAEPAGDAETVHIFKRTGSVHLSGRVDESNGGRRLRTARQRRRAQQRKGTGSCPQTKALQSACGSTIAAGAGSCIVCVMQHFKSCSDDDAIDDFCGGGGRGGAKRRELGRAAIPRELPIR